MSHIFFALLTKRSLVVALLVLAAGFVLVGHASAASRTTASPQATITVTGSGTATGTPDTLTVQMAVASNAASATTALDHNNEEMTNLENVIMRAGVKTSGLQTSNLSVSPNFDADGTVTGYGAQDDLTVTFHDIARAGTIIDTAAHAVGNDVQIEGISFSLSNTSTLLTAARLNAVHNAQREAATLANGAGTSLGPVMKITDHEQQTTPPPPLFYNSTASGAATKSAVPLQAGSEQVSVSVDVIYQLRS